MKAVQKMLPRNQKNKKRLNDLAKYSGLAFQMIVIILGGTFLGIKLDKWTEVEKPTFTIILILIAVILSMYYVIKDVIK